VVKEQVLQGEAAAKGAVLAVLDGFAAAGNAFAFYRAAVFADDVFFLVVGGIADVGGDVARGGEVGGFDQAQQVGGEVAEQFVFVMCRLFGGGFVAAIVGAELFQQGGAQAAFEGAAGDERRAGVRVSGGTFDVEAVVYGIGMVATLFALDDVAEAFLVFAGDGVADAADAVRGGAEGFGVVGEVFLDLLDVAAFGDVQQFAALVGIEFSPCRVEGVEGFFFGVDDVVGRLVVFAGAEVDGRERGEVQGVAVEEVWHGVFLLCCAVGW